MYANPTIYSLSPSGFFSIRQLKDILKEHTELVFLAVLFIGYQFYAEREQQLMVSVIEQPRKSDFFYVDYFSLDKSTDARHRYVPMKILEVNAQGVRFKVGNIAHSTPVSPRQHAKFDKAMVTKNYYRQKEIMLTHSEIKGLFDSGVIYNARRPKTIFIDGWIVIPKSEMYLED